MVCISQNRSLRIWFWNPTMKKLTLSDLKKFQKHVEITWIFLKLWFVISPWQNIVCILAIRHLKTEIPYFAIVCFWVPDGDRMVPKIDNKLSMWFWGRLVRVILAIRCLGNKCWPKHFFWKNPVYRVLSERFWRQVHIFHSRPYIRKNPFTKH